MKIPSMKTRRAVFAQAKPERTAEESDRLRKLMLEWQFQKRLQESKQSDDDEEEEDDEDVDTMMIMQRLEAEKRARVSARNPLRIFADEMGGEGGGGLGTPKSR